MDEAQRVWYYLNGTGDVPKHSHVQLTAFSRKGGGGMKGSVAVVKLLSAVCVLLLVQGQSLLAQEGGSTAPTKTIIGDLLDVDRDFYIVRGDRGEIQIEAKYKTEIT